MASGITRERSRRSGSVSNAKVVPLQGTALVLRIELRRIQPVIHRTIVIPSWITLPKLHVTILRAMGWQDGHLHEFTINGVHYGEPDPDYPEPDLKNEKRVRLDRAIVQVLLGHCTITSQNSIWAISVPTSTSGYISSDDLHCRFNRDC